MDARARGVVDTACKVAFSSLKAALVVKKDIGSC